ncbi:hypothetical protein ON010_g403 [Phytophthora cinnamomi]|nr:hypothetical protein ON010_g403 [Phytophthora cinnamomi]
MRRGQLLRCERVFVRRRDSSLLRGALQVQVAVRVLGLASVVDELHHQQREAARELNDHGDPDGPQRLAEPVHGHKDEADHIQQLEGPAEVFRALRAVDLDDLRDERRGDHERAHEPQDVESEPHCVDFCDFPHLMLSGKMLIRGRGGPRAGRHRASPSENVRNPYY